MLRKLILILFVFGYCTSNAQNTDTSPARSSENSPYSFYGIGNLSNTNFYHIDQMGGIGNSFSDTYTINVANPASYASLARTSFDVGLWAKNTRIKDATKKINNWSGNLGYLSIGFPLINPLSKLLERNESPWSFGAAFSLKPVSRVSYNISGLDSLSNGNKIVRNFEGNGGINEFVFGAGAKYKDLSFGANIRYQFGSIERSDNVYFQNAPNAYNNIFATEYSNRNFVYDLGAQYRLSLNKNKVLNSKNQRIEEQYIVFGATAGFSSKVKSDYEIRKNVIQTSSGKIDTISVSRGSITGTMPSRYGVGATYYYGNKLALGVDYSSTQWSQYEHSVAKISKGDLNDSYRIALGGYYRPSTRSFNSFYKKIQYKFGLYYEKDYRKVTNLSIDKQGVTFGLGMPLIFQRKFSQLNIGVELGRMGMNTPIQENYAKMTFGFSFGDDQWFIQRKYN